MRNVLINKKSYLTWPGNPSQTTSSENITDQTLIVLVLDLLGSIQWGVTEDHGL